MRSAVLFSLAAILVAAAVSSAPPRVAGQTTLVPGCQIQSLIDYDVGTPIREVTDDISGASARIWFLVPGSTSFQLYDPASEERSTKTTLAVEDEAAFICVDVEAVWARPGEGPGPEPASGPPAGADVRTLMELAVPQVTDLPIGFVSVDEFFQQAPAGEDIQYFYAIDYGNALGLFELQTIFFLSFSVLLFDDASSAAAEFDATVSVTADEVFESIEARFAGAIGLEIKQLTIEEIEIEGIGDEAAWRRLRFQARPVRSNELFLPFTIDSIYIRRGQVLGGVFAFWSLGPAGSQQQPRRLAGIMDANIQSVLPQLAEAVP